MKNHANSLDNNNKNHKNKKIINNITNQINQRQKYQLVQWRSVWCRVIVNDLRQTTKDYSDRFFVNLRHFTASHCLLCTNPSRQHNPSYLLFFHSLHRHRPQPRPDCLNKPFEHANLFLFIFSPMRSATDEIFYIILIISICLRIFCYCERFVAHRMCSCFFYSAFLFQKLLNDANDIKIITIDSFWEPIINLFALKRDNRLNCTKKKTVTDLQLQTKIRIVPVHS